MWKPICVAIALAGAVAQVDAAAPSVAIRQVIDKAVGVSGTYYALEDAHRLSFPRGDVKVSVDGAALHPYMGLTSWAHFTAGTSNSVVVNGELILLEDEVNPVLSTVLDSGLEVTALHNRFLFDTPRILSMRITGTGSGEALAAAVRKAIDAVREIRRVSPEPTKQFSGPAVGPISSIDAEGLNGILRTHGQVNGGMYKASFLRAGVNSWSAFFGSMNRAFVDGELACTRKELQTVLKSLRKRGIYVVAIHSAASLDAPPLTVLHYWGKGRAAELAVALRAVLDEQARVR
jgi:hypothetical protein